MTEFITRCYGKKGFEIIVKTDNYDHYEATQAFAQRLIDHAKPVTDNNVGCKTNADRIRAMTDEELADFLTKENWRCDNYSVCRECPRYIAECCLPLNEWLQQPAKGE